MRSGPDTFFDRCICPYIVPYVYCTLYSAVYIVPYIVRYIAPYTAPYIVPPSGKWYKVAGAAAIVGFVPGLGATRPTIAAARATLDHFPLGGTKLPVGSI